jgi:hypothetical protein
MKSTAASRGRFNLCTSALRYQQRAWTHEMLELTLERVPDGRAISKLLAGSEVMLPAGKGKQLAVSIPEGKSFSGEQFAMFIPQGKKSAMCIPEETQFAKLRAEGKTTRRTLRERENLTMIIPQGNKIPHCPN